MKKLVVAASSIAFLSYSLSSCQSTPQEETPQTTTETTLQVEENEHHELGYSMAEDKNGERQSPINIVSLSAEKEESQQINYSIKDEINKIENLGHTVQLDFKEGNIITENDKSYEIKQVHFHTPSEHLIDGISLLSLV